MRRDPWCGPGDGVNSMPLSCYKEQFVVCFLQGINYGSSAHKTQKFGGRSEWNVRSYMRIFVFELTKCPTVTLLTSRRELLVFCWHTFLNGEVRVRIRCFRKLDRLAFVWTRTVILSQTLTFIDIKVHTLGVCDYSVGLSSRDGRRFYPLNRRYGNLQTTLEFPDFLQLPRQPMTNRARKSSVTSSPKRLINRLNPVMHPLIVLDD